MLRALSSIIILSVLSAYGCTRVTNSPKTIKVISLKQEYLSPDGQKIAIKIFRGSIGDKKETARAFEDILIIWPKVEGHKTDSLSELVRKELSFSKVSNVSWSPNSKYIAIFVQSEKNSGAVIIVNPAILQFTIYRPKGFIPYNGCIDSTGGQLLFIGAAEKDTALFLYDFMNKKEEKLVAVGPSQLRWSNDGSRLLFIKENQLWQLRLDSKKAEVLSEGDWLLPNLYPVSIFTPPNPDTIFVVTQQAKVFEGKMDIWKICATIRQPQKVASLESVLSLPAFDKRMVYVFQYDSTKKNEIFTILDIRTGAKRDVKMFDSQSRYIDPVVLDTAKLLCVRIDKAEIYLFSILRSDSAIHIMHKEYEF